MKGVKPLALAAFAGLASGLGHAPFALWPVSIAGFAGLIWLVSRADRPERVAWAGGAAYFGLTLHWIVEPFLVDIETHGWMAPFALFFLATGLALLWGVAGWLSSRMAGPRALAFALALASVEVVRGHLFTGFPWALPGYIWVETPVRHIVAYLGSYGLTALTLLAAAFPAALSRPLAGAGAGIAALVAMALPGILLDPIATESLGTVRLLQPNIPQNEKWHPDHVQRHFRRKLELTGRDGAGADFVAWPESAVVWPLDIAGPALEAIAAAGGVPAVVGLNRREGDDWFNALAVFDDQGAVTATFDKVHLVPFGEYIPFRLGFIRGLAARSSNGYTAGGDVRLVETPLGSALPMICYEGIFPGQVFRAGARADFLLLLTNDAWFGTFAGPQQHFDQARFRATEHGLSLVRAANKGVSTVIGPRGDVAPSDILAPDLEGVIDLPVPASPGPTLYARTGNAPLYALLLAAMAGALIAGRRNRIAHRPPVG